MPDVFRRATTAMTGAALCVSIALSACGGDDGGSAERFCGEIDENKAALTDPPLESSDQIEPVLELYREIAELAPLAIEDEWNQLLEAYETASTVVPEDPQSVQTALAAIYASEGSAAEVERWLQANCAVEIGPVFTIVEHAD